MKIITTNDFGILDGEKIKRWDQNPTKDDPRPVSIQITSWVGQCPGATHYTIDIAESKNYYWSESENAWVSIMSSDLEDGISARVSLTSKEQSIKIAKSLIKQMFGDNLEGHQFDWTGPGCPDWINRQFEKKKKLKTPKSRKKINCT